MATPGKQDGTRRIFVFDSPRTCSQLFYKLFAVHPQLGHIFHPTIMAASYGPERLFLNFKHCQAAEEAQLRNAEKANIPDETYALAAGKLQEQVDDAEKKYKIPFIKEHCMCCFRPEVMRLVTDNGLSKALSEDQLAKWNYNPTPLSNELFQTITPVILIRHPALAYPSFYTKQKLLFEDEAWDEEFAVMTSFCWARMVFDCFNRLCEQEKVRQKPIVVDAWDIVNQTQGVIGRLCEVLGLDKGGVQYKWEPTPREEWPADPCMQEFYREILTSTGVRREGRGKAKEEDIDLDSKTVEWTSSFGEKTAIALRHCVEAEMDNYEYLKQHKLA